MMNFAVLNAYEWICYREFPCGCGGIRFGLPWKFSSIVRFLACVLLIYLNLVSIWKFVSLINGTIHLKNRNMFQCLTVCSNLDGR